MPTVPLRSSRDGPSSILSSDSDIPVATSPEFARQQDEAVLPKSSSLDSSDAFVDDLEFEDPLSRVYVQQEFERFSGTEIIFITASCTGVLAVPLLYFITNKLNVFWSMVVC